MQLAVQRLLGGLALPHAALRKLPALAAGAPPEEQLAVIAHQDDADIGPESVAVDHVTHDHPF